MEVLKVWPKPAAHALNIQSDQVVLRVRLFDASGRLVHLLEGLYNRVLILDISMDESC